MDVEHFDEIVSGEREMKRYLTDKPSPSRHVKFEAKAGLPDPSITCDAGGRRVEAAVGNRAQS